MQYLHITNTEKFIEPFIIFTNNNFKLSEHQFLCFSTCATNHIKNSYANVDIEEKVLGNISLIKKLYEANQIYFHGLFDNRIVILLFLQPWLLKKCYWIVWGADLYAYRKTRITIKAKVKEFIRAFVIKRIAGLITHIKGDYNLAKKWYGVKGKYYYSFMYPSNLYKKFSIAGKAKDDIITHIQIGNSADPSNNHLEVFEKLRSLELENIHIICPLSYGDKEYTERIVKSGREMFGNNFEPLLEFIPLEKYLEVLSKVDVAIFNHNRQQAVGNITTLIGLGKKVFLRDDITTWDFCKEHGLTVYSTNKDFENVLEQIDKFTELKNIQNVKCKFSEEKLIEDFKKIFS